MNKVELNHLPDTSKVWIFASPNPIEEDLSKIILNHISDFLNQWKAHGKELKSHKQFIDNHFLIVAVDESFEQATGCSIDSMVHFISEIEKKYHLSLTDRSLIYYKDNQDIKTIPFLKVKDLINAGKIKENTLIYDNSIINGKELKRKWLEKAEATWVKKYFQKSQV